MRKIFSFLAAMLVAIAANAVETPVNPGSGTLKAAVDAAAAGDVLVLADGVYSEPEVVDLNKDLTIQAAEDAHPVVAQQYYMKLLNSAKVTFIGIKFDGGLYNDGQGANDHCIRAYDATAGKTLTVIDCEFCNWKSYILYPQRADRCADALTIRNCYFHDNKRCAVFTENVAGALGAMTIENSTFANFTEVSEALIAVKNGGAEEANQAIRVDHCTFYNYVKNSTGDYSFIDIRKSTDVVISNCIFAQPEEGMSKATYCYGGTIDNCLIFNTTGHRSGNCVVSNGIVADPLFKDAANGDFTLLENSPALTLNNGKPIGDPRWVSAAEEPLTLYLKLSADWAGWPAKYAIYYFDDATNGWSDFMTAVPDTTNIYVGTIPAEYADDKIIFVRLNGEATEANWDNKWSQTVNLEIPEGKDFFTVTSGGTGKECNGVWSKYGEVYVPTLANGYYLVGTFNEVNAWEVGNLTAEKKFTVNPNDENEYTIVADLAAGDKFKAVYVENDAIKTWYPEGSGNDYVVTEQTAGEKTIYFRPTYNEEWGGHFYIAPNVEPVEPAAPVLWKATAETPTAAGSTLINDDLLTLASVYESFVSGTSHTYGEEVFAKAFQVRAINAPTAENLTGDDNNTATTEDKKKASPLVLTAKEDIEVTFYYRQQQTVETPAAENDNKDLWIFDQTEITTKMTGTHTSVDVSDDSKYAFVTKKMTFTKNHVYTLTAVGTTLPLFGLEYKATEGGGETTALTNTEASVKAVKKMVNGILIIEKAGVKYNVLGQTVR